MWFKLQPVELDFLDSAPRRWVVEARLNAPRAAVWDAFVDPGTWCHWFPDVLEASYPGSTPPHGVGTRRFSHVGRQYYEETMLAWDEGIRWAYRIDRTTLPLSSAHVESTEFEDDGSGTRLRWTLAAKPRLMLRLSGPFMERMLQRLLAQAAQNLDRHLDT
jgi:uncharacterized protein YndB with AHSA1/START domain